MAEALVVLGVAAASAQFLQFGVEALRICKEIRDNGATDNITQLERYFKELKHIQKILPSTPSSTAGGRRINEVGIKCSGTGDELFAVLQHVKGAASGKASVFRVSMRAMRSRKTIEKLANALKDYQRLLDLALSADMGVKVQQLLDDAVIRHAETTDRLAQMATSATAQHVQNRGDIGSLHTDIRAGIKQTVDAAASKHAETIDRLSEMATSSAAQHGQTCSQVTIAHSETIDQLSQLQLRVTGGHDRLQHDMHEATTAVRGDLASANEMRQRESFLKSLHFEDMERREASIKSALARTYDWVFDKSYDQQRTSGHALSRVTLRQWLHSNQSTYWVSGKAGSGKSTLMAFINGDRRLDEALESWAGNQAYIKVGCFFWRAGSWLQTHITGLLRSILHQLCRARSRVVDKLASFYGNFPVWTEGNLLGAIRKALRLLHNVRVFMVIDGLDELEGDYDQLLEVMFVLASGTMRKMCIASRPETILAHRLSSLPGLRLEDLSLEGIHRYVYTKLCTASCVLRGAASCALTGAFARDVVNKSSGVFLWAMLVTDSLMKGHTEGDNKVMLRNRLVRMPLEIHNLIASITGEVDPEYQHSLAFYFRAMYCMRRSTHMGLSVATIAAATTDKTSESLVNLSRSALRPRSMSW